jgi:hypothetical protein
VRKSVWTLVRQLAVHRGVRLSSAFALFIGMFIIYNALGMMNTCSIPISFALPSQSLDIPTISNCDAAEPPMNGP